MRRAVSVLSVGALVAALWSAVAFASSAPSLSTPPISLSREVFDRCFGLADTGRPRGESPLAQYVFVVEPAQLAIAAPVLDLASISLPHLAALVSPDAQTVATPSASYVQPVLRRAADMTTLDPDSDVPASIGYYQDSHPTPAAASAPGASRFALPNDRSSSSVSGSPVLNPATGFTGDGFGTGSQDGVPQIGRDVSMPVRIGHVRMETHADAGRARSDALAYNDTAMGGGATFDARLGKWKQLGIDLSTHYEHVTVDQTLFAGSSVDGSSNLDLANDHLPVFVPAYADISKHTVSAGLAVPVSRRMVASVHVDAQHLLGGYGTPGLANLDANNMIYGARLTYQLKGASAISLSAKQFRYQDNLVPLNAFTQTSAALNYTVKF